MGKKIWISTLAFSIALFAGCEAGGDEDAAADFPEGPVELIVPYDAGGGTDAVARALADATEEHLGESIGVVNTTGGGGAVGFTEGATAAPDGQTVTLVTVELVTLPHMGLADVSHEDFKAIGQMNFDPPAVTVPADAPYDTLEEFIDYAEENPGEIQMGNSGSGSIWHLAASAIEQETGVEFEHVPFDGAAPAVTSLLGGHIDAVPVSPAEVLPQVEGEELKTLAVMDEERAEVFPEVPTFEEEGFSGADGVGPWRGVVVPEDTPDEVASVLEEAFMAGAEEPEFQEFMEDNGLGMTITDGESFGQMMGESYDFYGELISDLGLE
ncbi:tripartite tricarboxylate transporter substrate binding protein [Salicibibacter cibi]|uniref:Tripartite tricarboxylate transporter substrate binding protein n=1 Tax=Salicibibacter cibi TaxID=2743001 RepID=A0A7T7CE96_9BACI|nr:tripartite tricarboxylate transporter substrate binding protein [Salicibibacter cibi]QQK78828.1 tripartite tricarboxylate transporter substrate binding protein [Salicibibacter cibi]